MLTFYAVCSGRKMFGAWEQLPKITVLKKSLDISILQLEVSPTYVTA